jgi:glycerol-3-phosphate acyltransferase PlsY
VSRTASIASLVTISAIPIAVGIWGRPAWETVTAAAIAALVVMRHRDNLGRLRRGEERSLH